MGPIWGRQDPGGPHVGPTNFAIWDVCLFSFIIPDTKTSQVVGILSQGKQGDPLCTQSVMVVWWPGDKRSQDISKHGVDSVWLVYYDLSTSMVKTKQRVGVEICTMLCIFDVGYCGLIEVWVLSWFVVPLLFSLYMISMALFSIANALELLQSCTKPSIYSWYIEALLTCTTDALELLQSAGLY